MKTFKSVLRQRQNKAQTKQTPLKNIHHQTEEKSPTLAELMEYFVEYPEENYTLNFCRNHQLIESRNGAVEKELFHQSGGNEEWSSQKKKRGQYVFKTEVGKRLAQLSEKKEKLNESSLSQKQNRQSINNLPQQSSLKDSNQGRCSNEHSFKKVIELRNKHMMEGRSPIKNKECPSTPKVQSNAHSQKNKRELLKNQIQKTNELLDIKIGGLANRIGEAKAEIAEYLKKYEQKPSDYCREKGREIILEGISEIVSEQYDSKIIESKESKESSSCAQMPSEKSVKQFLQSEQSLSRKKVGQSKKYETVRITESSNFTFDFDVQITDQPSRYSFRKK